MSGHVFVTRGDITHLNVDAWLLPTDRDLNISDSWLSGLDQATVRAIDESESRGELADLRSERAGAAVVEVSEGSTPVLTAVPYDGAARFEELEGRLREGLRLAAETAFRAPRSQGREKPIIATPAFGVRGGGANAQRGSVVAGLLRVARQVAEENDVDVVVCLQRAIDHALAQTIRLREWESTPPLDSERLQRARALAELAKQGRLVPFMGAGVSVSAGLPTWDELLAKLAEEREPGVGRGEWFGKLSAIDQAQVVRADRTREEFGKAVGELTRATRYGLAPILLAALPTNEAVTLNYDQLYEMASKDADRELAVLPFDGLASSNRWLLKMHGCVSHPESIVLTRGDYIDFRSQSATAASLARAILMTKHLLFVGFGLSDDHFHDLVHDVRASVQKGALFGTALVLGAGEGHRAVWGDQIDFETFSDGDRKAQTRDLEIFLDVLGAFATTTDSFVLDDRFETEIPDQERRAKDLFLQFMHEQEQDLEGTAVGSALSELRLRLGG